MGRDPGKVRGFQQPLNTQTPKPLDRGALFHYWHPDRDGVEFAPATVAKELTEIAGVDERGRPKLVCVRPPKGAPVRCNCWLVFKRSPEVTHELSPGWFLVMAWHDGKEPDPAPLPLDPRLYANLYLQSVRGGRAIFGRDFDSAVKYFDHCMSILDREKERRDKSNTEYREDRAKDYWDYTKIKNIGHGSKFALHHDGTIMPTRQEANWLRERGVSLPADVVARDADEIKRASGRTSVHTESTRASGMRQFNREFEELKVRQLIRDLAKARRRETVAVR